MGQIYRILNLETNKSYIGKTTQTSEIRFSSHLQESKRGNNRLLYKSMRKHGTDKFTIEVLADGIAEEDLDSLEQFFVIKFNSKIPNGYNMTDGGEGPDFATRTKISGSRKGHKFSEETKAKIGHASRNRSPESNRKISEALKGRKLSDEHKAKIGAASRGRKLSAEHKAKLSDNWHDKRSAEYFETLSEKAKKQWENPEHRKNMSEKMKGNNYGSNVVHTEEFKSNLAQRNRERIYDDAARERMRQNQKKATLSRNFNKFWREEMWFLHF